MGATDGHLRARGSEPEQPTTSPFFLATRTLQTAEHTSAAQIRPNDDDNTNKRRQRRKTITETTNNEAQTHPNARTPPRPRMGTQRGLPQTSLLGGLEINWLRLRSLGSGAQAPLQGIALCNAVLGQRACNKRLL